MDTSDRKIPGWDSEEAAGMLVGIPTAFLSPSPALRSGPMAFGDFTICGLELVFVDTIIGRDEISYPLFRQQWSLLRGIPLVSDSRSLGLVMSRADHQLFQKKLKIVSPRPLGVRQNYWYRCVRDIESVCVSLLIQCV